MKKHFLKIFILFMFFVSPVVVNATFGDVRYEITDVNISNSTITFKGWAFIHKTNNYVNVESAGLSNGGQKILMRAVDSNGNVITEADGTAAIERFDKGETGINYNFYCELFYNKDNCISGNYSNKDFNSCEEYVDNSYCYYEDTYFKISFDTSKWNNVSENDKVKFQIAVSNNDYENKISDSSLGHFNYDGDTYTQYTDISVVTASVAHSENDYMKIETASLSNQVEFIASYGLLYTTSFNERFKYGGTCSYGEWKTRTGAGSNIYNLSNITNYSGGRSTYPSSCGYDFLGTDCKGTHLYAISVAKTASDSINGCHIAPVCSGTDCTTAIARGSHVKISGSTLFKITIKNKKLCPVTEPKPSSIACNDNGTLSSVCEELTVDTTKGRAIVKIEQTGTVSSVLTPGRIYNGGGFNFGIVYQNNIKWSYTGSVPGTELHNAVNSAMNDKLKDYEAYIAGITLSNLKLGGDAIKSGMVKQCFSSSTNKNYYGSDGLTVSCIFTFPSSSISYDGTVTYDSDSLIGINNKYYTDLKKFGDFDVTVTINGMDRIKENASKSDSKENGKVWTGTWNDSIDGCEINVYPIMDSPSVIYRPIDLNNPFPNRNAGINWYDWYNVTRNRERLENTYSDLDYTARLDNTTISKIKNYNKNNNYLDWDSINKTTGKSSFVTEYVERVGDS